MSKAPVDVEADEAAERMLADRAWPVTVKLAHPVDFGSERIAELVFRRGRLGDLKGIKPDGIPSVDQLLLLASRMCSQPVKVLELLEDEDGAEVMELALGFFARSLGAGRKR